MNNSTEKEDLISIAGTYLERPLNRRIWHLCWISISIVLILSLKQNWLHWGPNAFGNDDIHREFVTPIRLAQGQVLYRDFNFLYGPLPPYVNSFVIKIPAFDVFTKLRVAALFLFLVELFLLWATCRKLRISILFGPMLLPVIVWTNQYTFNPTSFNLLYANMFASFGVLCALYTIERRSLIPWVGLGLALVGAFFSKPEGLFTVGLAFIAAIIVSYKTYKCLPWKQCMSAISGFVCAGIPLIYYLLTKGMTYSQLIEGVVQRRFQNNLNEGYFAQFGYFFGINGIAIILMGILIITGFFGLIKLLEKGKKYAFITGLIIISAFALILTISGSLYRITDDYLRLGDFFGALVGLWWLGTIRDNQQRSLFIVFIIASFGGWLRPFFHIGAIVIPYRVGGGIILATIFVFLMIPVFYQKLLQGDHKFIKKYILLVGPLVVLLYSWTALHRNWEETWRHKPMTISCNWGKFVVNSDDISTQNAITTINWIRKNILPGQRIATVGEYPIELVLGWLPCLPISQAAYQIYNGDTERIIHILDCDSTIAFVMVPIWNACYHFGIQDYRLADYLDSNWQIAERINVPLQLVKLAEMAPQRKIDAGLKQGILLYRRKLL